MTHRRDRPANSPGRSRTAGDSARTQTGTISQNETSSNERAVKGSKANKSVHFCFFNPLLIFYHNTTLGAVKVLTAGDGVSGFIPSKASWLHLKHLSNMSEPRSLHKSVETYQTF